MFERGSRDKRINIAYQANATPHTPTEIGVPFQNSVSQLIWGYFTEQLAQLSSVSAKVRSALEILNRFTVDKLACGNFPCDYPWLDEP